jgi:hypothetical protein
VSSAHANGVVDQPGSGNGAGPYAPGETSAFELGSSTSRRPEVAVGAAFVSGLLLAMLLRRVRS